MSATARPRSLASLQESYDRYVRLADPARPPRPHGVTAKYAARIRDDLARRIAEHPESKEAGS